MLQERGVTHALREQQPPDSVTRQNTQFDTLKLEKSLCNKAPKLAKIQKWSRALGNRRESMSNTVFGDFLAEINGLLHILACYVCMFVGKTKHNISFNKR